jgi:hypothetical protein
MKKFSSPIIFQSGSLALLFSVHAPHTDYLRASLDKPWVAAWQVQQRGSGRALCAKSVSLLISTGPVVREDIILKLTFACLKLKYSSAMQFSLFAIS